MRHSLPIAPQFYVTAPQPCPYLAGRMERKLFTALQGDAAEKLNNALSKQGFRRSQNVLYRPSCTDCSACMSARIKVADFAPTKSQKRVLKRNADLTRNASSPWATEPQYALFRDYLDSRHAAGGMADMDLFEFAAMVEETPIRTRLIEYRSLLADAAKIEPRGDPAGDDPYEGLRAVSLTDILEDGVSMVYSFFAPELMKSSVGTYLILDHIQIARDLDLPYVYLGYWVPGSDKMGYKANFKGVEIFRKGAWEMLTHPDDYSSEINPIAVAPIADQVARITLPDQQG
jgi:arginyl-tRNA--protein-N-Asp/Glu arginylyltransferase